MKETDYADRDGLIWFDGDMIPWREAKVHMLTHALHYGGAAFEGQRAYNGKIFKLEEHTDRLFKSAEILDYTVPFTKQQINDACYEVLEASGYANAYLRPGAWRGTEMLGLAARGAGVHAAIACWEWPAYFSLEARLKGLRLMMSQWRRPAPDMAPVHAKASGLYQICTHAKDKAERMGYNDALMLDYRGLVAEATGANVFFAKDGALHTPTPDCFLDGITRRTVIDLAREHGITVHERAIELDELDGFEECFLTGTAAEVSPVSEIGDYRFEVGDIAKTMMFAYTDLVQGTEPGTALKAAGQGA